MESGRTSLDHLLRDHIAAVHAGAQVTFAGDEVQPLAKIVAHAHPEGHWHFVTLGLTELDSKSSEDAERSGWGFELTLRVPSNDLATPPRWPVRVLQVLAAYVFEARSPFEPGHHIDLDEPLCDEIPTVTAFAIAVDPELGRAHVATGAMTFLQLVGLHADEEALIVRWSVPAFLDILAGREPLLVTRPHRPALLSDPELASLLEQRARAEGPRSLVAIAETLSWRRRGWRRRELTIELGPAEPARRNLHRMLGEITRDDRGIRLMGNGRVLVLRAGDTARWQEQGATLELTLTGGGRTELARFLEGESTTFASTAVPGVELHLLR